MNHKFKKLVCLLASYEADEPHVSSPDCDVGIEEDQSYTEYSFEFINSHRKVEHCGDCVQMPISCMRCWADHIWHKAEWIHARLYK